MNPLHGDGSEVGMKEEAELSMAQPYTVLGTSQTGTQRGFGCCAQIEGCL